MHPWSRPCLEHSLCCTFTTEKAKTGISSKCLAVPRNVCMDSPKDVSVRWVVINEGCDSTRKSRGKPTRKTTSSPLQQTPSYIIYHMVVGGQPLFDGCNVDGKMIAEALFPLQSKRSILFFFFFRIGNYKWNEIGQWQLSIDLNSVNYIIIINFKRSQVKQCNNTKFFSPNPQNQRRHPVCIDR